MKVMSTQADSGELTRSFLDVSRHRLIKEFWPRIGTCLDSLTDEQVWWRPNESSNSIGNLLLHLNGNVTQWILSALGGMEDKRNRDAEFAEREQVPMAVLRDTVGGTLADVDRVLIGLTTADLLRVHMIQGYEVSGMEAVYHVVEHFGMHYGQILYITKLVTGGDLGFYRHLSGDSQAKRV